MEPLHVGDVVRLTYGVKKWRITRVDQQGRLALAPAIEDPEDVGDRAQDHWIEPENVRKVEA